MKNLTQMRFRLANMERKWMLLISSVSCLSLLLVLALALASTSSSSFGASPFSLGGGAYAAAFFVLGRGGSRGAEGGANSALFAETKAVAGRTWSSTSAVGTVPRVAYMISGSVGDGERLKRTLQALYHPRNAYVVHLDLEAPPRERLELATFIKNEATFRRFGNVHMISKANLVTYRGPTMVANTLHGAALLLRNSPDWDWFINLSASDYPLVTQDDLLHTFSFLPRDLNFLEHTSNIGWKEFHRARPIIIDPGLYMTKKSDVFWVTQKRTVPTAFKLFTGSAWMMLSRAFMEYCIWGWDNLPRQVLMYYANFLSSPEGYFHTVICNAQEFLNTTVNHDLHYITWDTPPKQHPHNLGLKDFQNMNDSNAPFARKFFRNDPVLDKIDLELLDRRNGSFVPGGWCVGNKDGGSDPCVVVGDTSVIKPGKGSKRLQNLIAQLLSKERFRADQCK